MAVHPIDFELQADAYSTPELRAIFDERARLSHWLRFEAALAETQGELGVIPQASAACIVETAAVERLDLDAIRKGYQISRNSVIPVLKALRIACGSEHGEFVHHGATTQDVVDTGLMLELRDALAVVTRDLRSVETGLLALAERHRATPMIGRSHGQQAIPITFGMKAAIWLAEIRRHIERLKRVASDALFGQFGGAVGTLAALAERGPQVKQRLMSKLGLNHSLQPWHTARDNVAEICSVLTMATVSQAKIANEVFELGRTEFGELREPGGIPGAMSSSTMPHKRNPVLCQRIVVLASHVRSLLSVVMEAMLQQNERDPRALWSEWLAVPQIAVYAGTATTYLDQVVNGLEVFPEDMLRNLNLHGDLVASEWLMFRLAGKIGKVKAQKVLHRAGEVAAEKRLSLVEILRADSEIGSVLNDDDLTVALQPELYSGMAASIVDVTLGAVRSARATESA
ncbi:MAG: adenylosuccinate lyase family protein [Acidihalobacter sp.]|uniref:class-II fumarase/aspartase family protein n=1 Tax=Acidihalobacter sp. TaxID=1872108 RepID=UPI00307EFD1E